MAKIILNVELAKSNVVKNLKELEAGIQGIGKSLGDVKVNKNLTAQLNALTNNYKALTQAAKEAQKVDNKQAIEKQKLAKATAQASTAKITEQKATVQLQTAQVRLTKAQESGTKVVKKATEENEKHRQSILSMAQGFFQWQMAATLVMKPLQMVRQAWASINETLVKTEDAVIALQRVLNDDSLSDSTISGKLYDLAQRYGQTFDNVNDIAQNFARTGMSWNETIQATESALLALNVAELDATQASDGMIAIMQQFGKEASDLIGIIDMLNKTADNYAVTTDKLLTALQRTGSSASNANLSLAETVGLITALSEATGRSGENLGTAINSLIQYSSKETALDTFASLDQNTADIVAKYRKGGATILDVWMAVSGVINNMDSRQEGILAGLGNSADITDLNQELQDELGDIFESINDVYGTANTFRKNYFIALLGNMQTVQDAIETASDANGYSQKENEKYLNTYTAKVNTLNAKWEELVNNEQGFLGFKKGLVDLGILGVDILDWMGGLRTASIALFGVAMSFLPAIHTKLKAIGITMNATMGWITLAASLLSIGVGVYQNIQQAQEEARQQAIANYEANKKEADSLLELYNRFEELKSITEKTVDQQYEFNTVTKSIVENLGYEAYKLKDLKKGSEEYLQVLKTVTQEKLHSYALESQAAANAQKEIFNSGDYDIHTGPFLSTFNTKIKNKELGAKLYELFPNAIDNTFTLAAGEQYRVSHKGNAFDVVNDYTAMQEWLYNNGYGEDEVYTLISSIISGAKEVSETYLKAQIENLFYKTASEKGIDYAQSNFESLIGGLISEEGIKSDYLLNFINEYAKGIFGIEEITKETVDTTKTWEEQSASILTNYKDLIDYLTEIRDKEKEINDLEEKREALENARNNKTVRVYNAGTGQWELQADEKAIAKAEEAYEEALLKSLEDEKLTVGQILEKVEGLPTLTTAIIEWLKGEGYNVPNNLMFGSSIDIPSVTSGMSSNVNNSTNDNRTYMVNGVPITQQQAEQYTIIELFEAMPDLAN